MSYIINKAPQGSEEWQSARAGLITASDASKARKIGQLTDQQRKYVNALKAGADQAAAMLIAGYKKPPTADAVSKALAGIPVGEWGDESKRYAFRKAVERITRKPLDSGFAGNFFTKRGARLEDEARCMFELAHECIVEEVGLIISEDKRFGASADGWIGDDAGVEIKCFTDPSALMPMLLEGDFSSIRDQCLMNLWLSGRKVWNQVLYVPDLAVIGKDLTVSVIDRRHEGVESEIEALEADLLELDRLVESYKARLLAGAQPAELIGEELESA